MIAVILFRFKILGVSIQPVEVLVCAALLIVVFFVRLKVKK
jgi:hypothetical protein